MRWIIRGLLLLFILAGVAAASLLLLPGERIARIASDQISAVTGREVTMRGDTALSIWPVLGVSTGAVTVANAGWGEGGPLFEAQSLKIGVEPQVLWGGDIRITGLEAVAPEVNLERAADGRVNWELGVEGVAPSGQTGEGEAPAEFEPLALTLDRALITDAALTYTDHGSGARTEMRGMDLDLRWPDYDGRATFDITLRPAGAPVRVAGHLDRVGDFIAGAVSDAEATVSTKGGSATFDGRVSSAPKVEGRLTAGVGDSAGVLRRLGLPAAEIPAGLGRSLDLDTRVTLDGQQRLSLRETVLELDEGNRITGAADVALGGAKPRVTAQLDAGALDLSGLAGGDAAETGGADGAAAGQGWSKAPIDAAPLGLANAEIALSADSVQLGDLSIGKTRTMATLDRSRLVFELRELRAYEAAVTGNFVVNNRSGLSVGGDITAAGLAMEPFLRDAAGIDRFSGAADGNLSFLGVGQSVHAIMNSLSGEGAVKTGRGVIKGIDLDKLMRSGQATGGTTIFEEMSASFTMQNGRLRNDDLAMKLPLARAEGEGVVGLGQRDIDYLFTPVLLEGETARGIAIPVRIRGAWADPSIKPDLEKAIDANFEKEKEELKTRAEDEVRKAVEDELGVEPKEGQSVEDAAKDKLKDEVENELKKLFE